MHAACSQSLITLTTDFGLADHYAGTMKGVILSRCPSARLVDISHQVPAFSLYSGAYTIDQAAPFYPPGSIHVVVVDPGVGTSRRALLVEAIGQYFVAPDNGVLSMILARDDRHRAWEITNSKLWLDSPASTFHGRDVFAPVAAALASGLASPGDVGPLAQGVELLGKLQPEQVSPGTWQGMVLSIDQFGNVITNFPAARFTSIASRPFSLRIGAVDVTRWHQTFGAAQIGQPFAYFGSSGYIEAALNQGHAAGMMGTFIGDLISLQA